MRRSNSLWKPLENAQLQWTGSDSPRSAQFDDIYYSGEDGPRESQYVFLEGNGLPQRWRAVTRGKFCIVETGFGTGLNFIQTWKAWRQMPAPRPRLQYVSIEKHPLSATDMARALAPWPDLAEQTGALLAQYPQPLAGTHRLVFESGALTLDLWWEDIADALTDISHGCSEFVDAWYLDGFAPARNGQMWGRKLFSAMRRLSRPSATFATFTAAGEVRRGLGEAGFKVDKVPGFGHKRECLRGTLAATEAPTRDAIRSWDIPENTANNPVTALILGAGLAGCSVASALAQRGIDVTVLEQNGIASAGSGNNQGILYTRLSTHHSALSDFALESFGFAHNHYRQLFDAGKLLEGRDGALCGSFHQSSRDREMAQLAPILASVPELAQVLDAEEASTILGVTQTQKGYWFPGSGWLRPEAVCRALLNHPNITVLENSGPITLQARDNRWLGLADGETLGEADCAVIATGTSTTQHPGMSWLPLAAIRGQTTHLPASPLLSQLQTGFCHSGYICPGNGDYHCIGATFDPNENNCELRSQDHRRNLEALANAVPHWRETLLNTDPDTLDGRVSYRCATPDYLPVAGPVPDYPAFLEKFAALRKNAKRAVNQAGDYIPGLYLSAGHGSRGLTSTPLTAQVLASQICAEAPPISPELQRAIAPGRFIIRQLNRGRI
jgi:tRNA 5-methylaminomethyl-2-thiouridine biosynthesis bifunctional protein